MDQRNGMVRQGYAVAAGLGAFPVSLVFISELWINYIFFLNCSFWSTMVYNLCAIEAVVSFTQAALPYYLAGVVRSSAEVFPLY